MATYSDLPGVPYMRDLDTRGGDAAMMARNLATPLRRSVPLAICCRPGRVC
jgi:hypothetical protein